MTGPGRRFIGRSVSAKLSALNEKYRPSPLRWSSVPRAISWEERMREVREQVKEGSLTSHTELM